MFGSESFRPNQPESREKKKVVGIDFNTDGEFVKYRERFEGKVVGEWQETDFNGNNTEGFPLFRRTILLRYGLSEN